MSRQVIATPHAPAAVGPYSQAIRSGNTGGLPVAAQNPKEQEEMDDEE